jgi:hypothetical protein
MPRGDAPRHGVRPPGEQTPRHTRITLEPLTPDAPIEPARAAFARSGAGRIAVVERLLARLHRRTDP